MIELTFHGACRRTTGSMHLLRHEDARASLDCGLFQGHRDETRQLNEKFPLRPGQLDVVLLSHAHIDHSGRLPLAAARGFEGPIFATPATRDLCGILLPDSGHIQEEDAEYWNKKHAGEGERIRPLYTVEQARAALPQFRTVDYDTPWEVCPGCQATFVEAGHILGSAMILLEMNRDRKPFRLLYSGDVGRFDLPILKNPTEPLPECDYLITECTYADRRHENPTGMEDRLCRVIRETAAGGGKVIIPAFSVGRTQNILYYLMDLFERGRLKRLPVFVDSPLSASATEVFQRHPECYDREAIERWGRQGDLFGRDGLVTYVTDVEDSKALHQRTDPCVILSASGMCESGRILHHLKNNVENPRNAVVIVGFMAQHTLGRRIVERRQEIRIFGRTYRLLARVEILNGFSAHADVNEFRRLYAPVARKLRRAFVVHGEDAQPAAMRDLLNELGCRDVVIPSAGDSVRLD